MLQSAQISELEAKPRDLVRAVFRHKGKALGFFFAVIGAVAVATMLYPKVYRSEAKLFLRLGRENTTIDPTATLGREAVVAIPWTRENEVNSVVELASTRSLLTQIVDAMGAEAILQKGRRSSAGADGASTANAWWLEQMTALRERALDWLEQLNLTTRLSDREKAIIALGKHLSVTPVKRSDVVAIAYEGQTPELAQAVVSRLTDLYLAEHARINRASGAHEFLARQTNELRERLSQAEQQLRDLKNNTGLAVPEVQRPLIATRIGRLEDELAAKNAAVAAVSARMQQLREILASEPAEQVVSQERGRGNEGTDNMRGQLYNLRLAEQAAAAKYTNVHPLLEEIGRQAAQARRILDGEEPLRELVIRGPARGYEQAKLAMLTEQPQMASLQAEVGALQTQLAQAREDLKVFNGNELRLAELQREVEIQIAAYRRYSESAEQTRIDEALESQRICNISVAQQATFNPQPVRPSGLLNLLMGLVVGLTGSVALALLAESRDHTLRSAEDVERKLELPVLMSVPRWKHRQLARSGRT